MSLKDFTAEQLKDELERRKKVKSGKPEQWLKPEWEPLTDLCQRYVDDLAKDGYVDDDMKSYIFEAAMKSVFGENVFDWVKEVRDERRLDLH